MKNCAMQKLLSFIMNISINEREEKKCAMLRKTGLFMDWKEEKNDVKKCIDF